MEAKELKKRLLDYNKTLHGLSDLEKELTEKVEDMYFDFYFIHSNTEHFEDTLEELITKNNEFKGLLKDNSDALLLYLQNIRKYSCSMGRIKVDTRSDNILNYKFKIISTIGAFYVFYGANLSIKSLIYGEYRDLPRQSQLHCIITAELLNNNKEVIQYCKDVLMSENNTGVLTRNVIIAIEQSNNKELQDLLTQVFLAAKLQEGLRQAVVETVNENSISYFMEIIDVILKEKLYRFSSVQRGVMKWTGISYKTAKEKDIQYILNIIHSYLKNDECRKEGLLSNNPLEVYLALYVKGIYSIEEATQEVLHLLDSKERHIVAAALVYFKLSCRFNLIAHSYLLKKYKDDEWIQGLILSEYNRFYFEFMPFSNEEAEFLMSEFAERLPKLKASQTYSSKGFEWFRVRVSKNEIAACMHEIVKKAPTQENVDLFMPYMNVSTQYYENELDTFMQRYFDNASHDVKLQVMEKGIISSKQQLADWCAIKYKRMDLTDKEIRFLERKLTTKKTYNRALIIDILSKQDIHIIKDVYNRLSASNNNILKDASIELKNKVPQILGESKTVKLLGKEDGFGFYKPKMIYDLPYQDKLIRKEDEDNRTECLDSIFVWNKEEVFNYLKKWTERLLKHENEEYYNGREYCQIKNSMHSFVLNYQVGGLDALPLAELWRSYFEEDNLSEDILYELNLILTVPRDSVFEDEFTVSSSFLAITNTEINTIPYIWQVISIITHFCKERNCTENINKKYMLIQFINEYAKRREYEQEYYMHDRFIISTGARLNYYSSDFLSYYDTDEEFKEKFPLEYKSYVNFNIECSKDARSKYTIHPFHIARAVHLNMLPKEVLYENILNTYIENGYGYSGEDNKIREACLIAYFQDMYQKKVPTFDMSNYLVGDKEIDKEVIALLRETLVEIMETLLAMEQQRINEETDATRYIEEITVFPGIKYLLFALREIEKEKITRSTNDPHSRTSVFVSVIKHSYLLDSDDIQELRDANIKEERLVEVAMLAPQWIDTIVEVLGWDSLKEACYYFIAHMKHYDYAQKKAEIAHYTSLEPNELSDGAFDGEWCKRIYASLGEKRFKMIYNASKFLCDNSNHSRAKKYADACLGKTDKKVLLKQINEKRNKDSLNAYCVMEMKKDKDLLERYMIIQKFEKESKNYGSQRQASEKRACDIAMLNLARNSRFETVTRLSWFLEGVMVSENADVLNPQSIEDIEVWIEIDENGKNEIKVRKNDKIQKSIPENLRNHDKILRLKEVHKNWSEQYKRSRKTLENALEERMMFDKDEIEIIMNNPIVAPIMKKLVLKSNDNFGFYDKGKIVNKENIVAIEKEVYIAHSYDLYEAGVWQDFQAYIFTNKIIQPFKQVFRELYLKLNDEFTGYCTNRYTGYQIQAKKAAATLKGRGWNISYENRLERVYYKSNLVVNLYANADWFSPSEIEAPSIDYIEFRDRTGFSSIQIKDIDDVLFSEIMRDIDLAVSTAYVGGVDPVTSFSTIELRRSMVKYTAQLMKLDNIEVQDHFVNIKGVLNEYSIHLGSGLIHQSGGAEIHIVPVFSGQRGKVYLPFFDEDPKSAEIISKIVMFAEDNKIKDPSILEQIR